MPGRTARLLLLAPAALIYGLLFVASGLYFFVLSFWTVKSYKVVHSFTLDNYYTAFTVHFRSGAITLALAGLIALLTTVVGFTYAWIIRFRAGRLADTLLFIALLTLFGGYLMKIYAWKTMLGNEGAINTALLWLGIVDQPISAIFYSPFAVVLTLTHFLLPFAILPVVGALRGIADAEIESARDLGAGGVAILRDIVVPQSKNGIMAAFALSFMIAVGDYFTPLLVGGKMAMVGQLIAPQFGTYFNWPLGAAMSFSIVAVSLAVLAAVNWVLGLVGKPA